METYDQAWVEAHVAQTVDVWHESAAPSAGYLPRYSVREQEQREAAYDAALEEVEESLEQTDQQERIVASFARFSANALGLQGPAITLLTEEFLPIGTQLARWSRVFDPTLSMTDIVQASRNAWTACGLQPLLGAPVVLTPSILGYSLLYPYSDNYLDDESISAGQKLRFSQRFRRRLVGESLPAADEREHSMWTLIAMIEEQFPRALYPQVFDSLLAIHQAQERSISQLHTEESNGATSFLKLSCAKGGTSVLADACLARGFLHKEESRFAFEWGVLLQLGDDLQDVRDDMRRGSETLFSTLARNGRRLDELTLQLLHFSEKVARRLEGLPHGSATLKGLLQMSWRSLIIRAVADSHEFFSSAFLQQAEQCSPFRFEFLRQRSDRLASRQGLYASLFSALLDFRHEECLAGARS
jgi:hypothetical protein